MSVDRIKKDRVGKQHVALNGMMMTIIVYRSAKDMDVQFEDGEIVQHVKYEKFLRGNVRHPNFNARLLRNTKARLGETNRALNGLMMTIIAYRSGTDIDIRFEDGVIVEHKNYRAFKNGEIKHPTLLRNQRVGEVHMATNGQQMIIIEYNNSTDVTVRFDDDTIVRHLQYDNIVRGNVNNPNFVKNARIGTTIKANNGMMMTVTDYRNTQDLDVMFEDGTLVCHVHWSAFVKGQIANPTISASRTKQDHRVGKTNIHQNGLRMTVIVYRNANDIDVQFEDGYIAEHVRYSNFLKGIIKYPGFSLKSLNAGKSHLGEKRIAKNGMEMVLIAYRNSGDVDVRFEDGTVVTTAYSEFDDGNVRNPNTHKTKAMYKAERTGEVVINNQGISMELAEYETAKHLKILFETGCEIKSRSYEHFHNGELKHPVPYTLGNIIMEKFAYTYGTIGNFYCKCTKCGCMDILSVSEMRLHICNI